MRRHSFLASLLGAILLISGALPLSLPDRPVHLVEYLRSTPVGFAAPGHRAFVARLSAQQQPTPIQQAATILTACTTANATAAVNNQVTLTITPPPSQFVYLCGWDVASSQNGTSTANTNVSYTSTNLGGWAWKYSIAATANLSITQSFLFNFPVKSSASGTAVTLVSPSALAQTAFNINAYYYYAY